MSFLWTVGMTCILLPMNYAASVFGTSAGSFFLGLDYTVLTITSVVFAAPFVDYSGPKTSLGLSCLALICYLACFVVADMVENEALKYVIMSIGMSLDGAFGSIGWVAQGMYYSRVAYLYHQKQGIPLTEARDYLVGLFMGIYMCVMLVLYTLSSFCIEFWGMGYAEVLTLLCALMIVVLVIFSLLAQDVKQSTRSNNADFVSVMKMTFFDHKAIAILHPMSMSFGFANVFFAVYVNVYTVDQYLGDYAVGYTNAIQCAIAAVIPLSIVDALYGRTVGLSLSSLAYVLLGGAYLVFTNRELGNWVVVVLLCAFYAIGRFSWLSSSRAIITESFAEDEAAAFASFNFINGLSSTLLCFILSLGVTNSAVLAFFVIAPALLMTPCYYMAKKDGTANQSSPMENPELDL